MIKNAKFLFFLYFFCFSIQAFSYTGGSDTSGGDTKNPWDGIAWFIGTENVVNYCLEVSPDFGTTEKTALESIGLTQIYWYQYFFKKREFFFQMFGRFFPRDFRLTKCNDPAVDLKFYFGVQNPEVEKFKQYYNNPVAFAQRTNFDPKTKRSKGFVWVAKSKSVFPDKNFPEWGKPYHLRAVLLHEWGHLYGCQHQGGTIMEENISEKIRIAEYHKREKSELTSIDFRSELILSENTNFEGTLGYGYTNDTVPKNFQTLVGRLPEGKVRARVKKSSDKPWELIVTDDGVNFHTFTMEELGTPTEVSLNTRHFKHDHLTSIEFYTKGKSIVYLGKLKTLRGNSLLVKILWNLNSSTNKRLVIEQVSDNKVSEILFKDADPGEKL